MIGSDVIGIAIGLIFVYLILSLFVTAIGEAVATIMRLRSKNLLQGIQLMLSHDKTDETGAEDSLAAVFTKHGMFKMLERKKYTGKLKRGPSYISKDQFSAILMDVLDGGSEAKAVFEDAKAASETLMEKLNALPDNDTKTALITFYNDANGDVIAFRAKVEDWFDNTMDRVSGWYKRKIKIVTFIIATVVTIFANADTIFIVNKLASDPEARALMEHTASDLVNNPALQKSLGLMDNLTAENSTTDPAVAADVIKQMKTVLTKMDTLKLQLRTLESITGMGWSKENSCCGNEEVPNVPLCIFYQILGWLLTIFAISLGAPFWFDMLKKIINIRGSGGKPKDANPTGEIKG